MWLNIFYLLTLFFSLLFIVLYYRIDKIKTDKKFMFFMLCSIFTTYGHSMCSFSPTVESMICGNQISVLGYILCTYFLLAIIIELCKKEFKAIFRIPLLLFALGLMVLVITADSNGVVYSSISISTYKGVRILNLPNGKLHFLFSLYMGGCTIAALIIAAISIQNSSRLSSKTILSISTLMLCGTTVYFICDILSIPFRLIPGFYAVADIVLFFIARRISLYDISTSLINAYEENDKIGYMTFDNKYRLMCYDNFCLEAYPYLSSIKMDSEVPLKLFQFRKQIIEPLEDWKGNVKKEYKVNLPHRHLAFTISYIKNSSKNVGFLISLRDESEQMNYISNQTKYNQMLRSEVQRVETQFTQIQDDILEGMATIVERRDNSTGDHIKRTSKCVKIFVDELQKHSELTWCTPEFCNYVVQAAPLHDLGKIAVDDSVLRKPGKYDDNDRAKMQIHPQQGVDIVHEVLKSINNPDFCEVAENVAHYHHEKWDGTGYPERKQGENIPVEARIMALADVFDALVSKRCYKDAFSLESAFKIIEENFNTHFDPDLGKIFLQCRQKLSDYYNREKRL